MKNDTRCEFHELSYKDETKAYRYFKKFFEVAKRTSMEWGHLDLLYYMETNHKNVKGLMRTDSGKGFLEQQCKITKVVLDKIINPKAPRIFVVTNSFARDLLGGFKKEDEQKNNSQFGLDYDFVWNDEVGTYTYKNNPFFFTSMLTGQRALDKGSFERLIWHINQIKNKLIN